MEKIERISRFFRYLFIIYLVGLPLFDVYLWLIPANFSIDVLMHTPRNVLITHSGALLINLFPTGVKMLGVYYLIKLFRLFEQGVIFARETVQYFKRIGVVIIASVFAWRLYDMALSVWLTRHNKPGQHIISIQFSSMDASWLVLGMLVLLISWIMDEGRKIYDENQYTV